MCLVFAACDNNTTTEEKQETTTEEVAATPSGDIDPVCEMEKDASWTNYQVYENDTVWFCSETCMTAFAGNPTKYMK